MAVDISTLLDIFKRGDIKTACNWFSYVYSFNMILLAISVVIFITKVFKGKHTIFTSVIYWCTIIGFSILTTIIFGITCHEPLPKSALLSIL
jgi:hypothetical protein